MRTVNKKCRSFPELEFIKPLMEFIFLKFFLFFRIAFGGKHAGYQAFHTDFFEKFTDTVFTSADLFELLYCCSCPFHRGRRVLFEMILYTYPTIRHFTLRLTKKNVLEFFNSAFTIVYEIRADLISPNT